MTHETVKPLVPSTTTTARRKRTLQADSVQRTDAKSFEAGVQDTVLADVVRFGVDEVVPLLAEKDGNIWNPADRWGAYIDILFGEKAGGIVPYADQYERLIKDIPSQFHAEILDEPNPEAAERSRNRVIEQMQRATVNGQQRGLVPALMLMAGSIVDIDAPLMFATGGGYNAAKVSRAALQTAQRVGLGTKGALRASSAAVGANAGLQAGLIVGTGQNAIKETADWTVIPAMALTSMILGAGLNTALGGDMLVASRAAYDELNARVAKNDPSLNNPVGPDDTNISPLDIDVAPMIDTSMGAAGQPRPGVLRHKINDPLGDTSPDLRKIGEETENWRHDTGWQEAKVAVAKDEEWWLKLALNPLTNLTTGDFKKLYVTNASVFNWMAGTVFESPNGLGRGRFTAATGMEMYHRQIASEYMEANMLALNSYAKRTGQTIGKWIPNQKATRDFYREVMLEMNERAMGRKTAKIDPDVKRSADAFDSAGNKALEIGKGGRGQKSIDGLENVQARPGHSPYVWDGGAVLRLINDGVTTKKDIINTLEAGYRAAGMSLEKDARLVAGALYQRAVAREADIDMNLVALMSGDGRDFLRKSLINNGLSELKADQLLERLVGSISERGKEGFAKQRNNIDLGAVIRTTDGSDLRIVDLMDGDLDRVWQMYSRRMSGSAALARVGITNKSQINRFIAAGQAQQRSMGEKVMDTDLLKAMFTHFEGGPLGGVSLLGGNPNKGIDPVAAAMKRMTNLALLNKLGLAQLAETGTQIAAVGLTNWMRRGPMVLFNKELRAGNTELLNDLAFKLGQLGMDEKLFAHHLDLDDINATDRGQFMKFMQGITQKATYIQGYTSLFNHVRRFQQQIVTMAMTDKIFRTLRKSVLSGDELDPKFVKRMETDLGIFLDDITELKDLIEDGTIEFHAQGFVNRVNYTKWDVDVAERFGAALTRNMNQTVQKTMAGESDAFLNSTAMSTIVHLKTFPLAAVQKQFVRNVRHTDMQSMATWMMGLSTAMIAVSLKAAIDGKDKSMKQLAKEAFGYSNMTGWIPMATDPVLTMLGLDDYRINQYGRYTSVQIPTLDWANRASRLPGSIGKALTGTDDYDARDSLKALPYYNAYAMSRFMP